MTYRYQQFWTFVIAMIACTHAHGYAGQSAPSAYGPASSADNVAAASSGDYQLAQAGGAAAGASADTAGGNAAAAGPESLSGSSYGSNQNLPYSPANTKGNTVTSSITYPQNKGEILIHRPAPIIVKRPPTKVLVNHPPLVVKPAPVVLHKPPAIVLRKVVVKHHPRPVKVEPVYVNVVKPPAEKYFVNEKQQQYANQYATGQQAYVPQGPVQALPAYASGADTVAANAGYQLLQGNQGLAALASLGNSGVGYNAGQQAGLSYGPASGHGAHGSYGNSHSY